MVSSLSHFLSDTSGAIAVRHLSARVCTTVRLLLRSLRSVLPMVRMRPTKPSRFPLYSLFANVRPSSAVSFLNLPAHQSSRPLLHRPSSSSSDPDDTPHHHSAAHRYTCPNNMSSSSPSSAATHSRLFNATIPVFVVLVVLAAVISPFLIFHIPRYLQPMSLTSTTPLQPSFASAAEKAVRPGVSVIAACTDRHPMLARALASWLHADLVRQIVVVDWSSSPPLKDTVDAVVDMHTPMTISSAGLPNGSHATAVVPDIHVVRVDGEPQWVMSRAYNLAARLAEFDTLLKVDCDIVVHPHVASAHPIPSRGSNSYFFAGNRVLARTASDFALEDVTLMRRDAFWGVGGYDERIQSYGFEAQDLYQRIEARGIVRYNLSYSLVEHILHHDPSRTQSGGEFPYVEGEVNRALLQRVGRRWGAWSRPSKYERVGDGEIETGEFRATYVPQSLDDLVNDGEALRLRTDATKERLHSRYRVPLVLLQGMDLEKAQKLQRNMDSWNDGSRYDEILHPGEAPPLVIIHVQNGIGNRLRVLGSALAFAKATDREPVVIWERDVHFGADFDELFDTSEVRYPVLTKFDAQWPLDSLAETDPTWEKVSFYNYMLDVEINPSVVDESGRSVYFKSSSIMASGVTTWESENVGIVNLPIRAEVLSLVNETIQTLLVGGSDGNNEGIDRVDFYNNNNKLHLIGGVHVRNRSLDFDIPGLSDNRRLYHERSMLDIDKWRAVTTMRNFVPTMRAMLNNGTVTRFFVSSDSISVCKRMAAVFGSNVTFIERGECDDRSAKCLEYALADLVLLSKTKPLLGSTWSSFTEAAMRLGGPKALLAGKLIFFFPRSYILTRVGP